MATLTSGDTLSLNALAGATGNTQNSNVSLGAIKGTPASGDNIGLSDYAIDSVGAISGYYYFVEGTSEIYTLTFGGAGTRFLQISSSASNFSWTQSSTTYIELNSNNGANATYDGKALNPQTVTPDPSNPNDSQTKLSTFKQGSVRCTFADGYNDHATNYNTQISKTVALVDSYDGNASALCLSADTPVLLSDGTEMEIGDLEEGMKLKGYNLPGLNLSEVNMLEWRVESELSPEETEVEVVNVIFSFAEKIYNINNGTLKATIEHPLLVNTNGIRKFKTVGTLNIGDFLIKADGSEDEITSIDIENGTVEIVSLDVNGPDTYLANGYITHNKGGNLHNDFSGPGAPTNLSFDSFNQILTWQAPSDSTTTGVTAYRVGISVNDFASYVQLIDEYSDTSISVKDNGILQSGTSYKIRVQAIESGLYGPWSYSITFTA